MSGQRGRHCPMNANSNAALIHGGCRHEGSRVTGTSCPHTACCFICNLAPLITAKWKSLLHPSDNSMPSHALLNTSHLEPFPIMLNFCISSYCPPGVGLLLVILVLIFGLILNLGFGFSHPTARTEPGYRPLYRCSICTTQLCITRYTVAAIVKSEVASSSVKHSHCPAACNGDHQTATSHHVTLLVLKSYAGVSLNGHKANSSLHLWILVFSAFLPVKTTDTTEPELAKP